MSITKRKLFSTNYQLQNEIINKINEQKKIKDLKNISIALENTYNFKMVATTKKTNEKFKCLCPKCNKWINEWDNWFEAKEYNAELKAKCSCGNIISKNEIIIEKIK